MTGPTTVVASVGSPTVRRPAKAVRPSTTWSKMLRWTTARVGAVQIWPEWKAQVDPMAVMAAFRSASSNTTAAPLPPSSMSRRFMVGAPAAAMRWPTAVDPVNDTMSTSGVEVSTDGRLGALRADQVDDAGREPDLVEHPGQLDDGQRVLGGGLDDDGVAHGQGRGDLAGHVGQREVVAGDGGHHADRLAVGEGADQAAGGQRGGGGGDRAGASTPGRGGCPGCSARSGRR